MNRTIAALTGLIASSLCPVAQAELSANVGWVSEYIFRGISQSDSSAYVGLDFERDGLYAGTWAADVDQGAEVDFYFGYGGELSESLSYTIGATGYFYTDDFDDTYKEINLNLSYDFLSFDANVGTYDNFSAASQDYSIYTLQAEFGDLYALVGSFSGDFDGEYYEAGYGFEVEELDFSVSIVHGTTSLLGTSDTSIVFGISKSLDLN